MYITPKYFIFFYRKGLEILLIDVVVSRAKTLEGFKVISFL